MLKRLKGKAKEVAQNQCKLNIRLNIKTLVTVANRVEQKMLDSEGDYTQSDMMKVMNAGQALFTDVRLGFMNGLSLEKIVGDLGSGLTNLNTAHGKQTGSPIKSLYFPNFYT